MSEITTLPPANDPRWRDAVTGKKAVAWQMLALKIMMTRLTTSAKTNPTPENIDKCVQELRGFFEKNIKLAQADLAALLG